MMNLLTSTDAYTTGGNLVAEQSAGQPAVTISLSVQIFARPGQIRPHGSKSSTQAVQIVKLLTSSPRSPSSIRGGAIGPYASRMPERAGHKRQRHRPCNAQRADCFPAPAASCSEETFLGAMPDLVMLCFQFQGPWQMLSAKKIKTNSRSTVAMSKQYHRSDNFNGFVACCRRRLTSPQATVAYHKGYYHGICRRVRAAKTQHGWDRF